MIVKIEGPIATFARWKAMVQSNSEKIKKYGMTFLYAGTEKDNDSKKLREVGDFIHSDDRVINMLFPIRDGLMVCIKQ